MDREIPGFRSAQALHSTEMCNLCFSNMMNDELSFFGNLIYYQAAADHFVLLI